MAADDDKLGKVRPHTPLTTSEDPKTPLDSKTTEKNAQLSVKSVKSAVKEMNKHLGEFSENLEDSFESSAEALNQLVLDAEKMSPVQQLQVKSLKEQTKQSLLLLKAAVGLSDEQEKLLTIMESNAEMTKEMYELNRVEMKKVSQDVGFVTKELGKMEEAAKKNKNAFQKIAEAFKEITGLDFAKTVTVGGLLATFMNFAKQEKEVAKMDRSLGLINDTIRDSSGVLGKYTSSLENLTNQIQTTAIATRSSSEEISHYMQIAGERGLNLMDQLNETGKATETFFGKITILTKGLGVSKETVSSLLVTFNSLANKNGPQATEAIEQMTEVSAAMRSALKITGPQVTAVWQAVEKQVQKTAMSYRKANGDLDLDRIKKYAMALGTLESRFKAAGLSAGQAAEMVEKLLDVNRVEENAFAYAQLGVNISDVLQGGRAADVTAQAYAGIDNLVKSLEGQNAFVRSQILSQMGGVLDEQTIAALSKEGAGKKEFDAAMEKVAAADKEKKSLEKLRSETLASLGENADDLINMFKGLMSLIKPLSSVMMTLIRPLTAAMQWLGSFLSAKDGLGAKIVGGTATIALGIGLIMKIFMKPKGIGVWVNNFPGGSSGSLADNIGKFFGKEGHLAKIFGPEGHLTKIFGAGGSFSKMGMAGRLGVGGGLIAAGVAIGALQARSGNKAAEQDAAQAQLAGQGGSEADKAYQAKYGTANKNRKWQAAFGGEYQKKNAEGKVSSAGQFGAGAANTGKYALIGAGIGTFFGPGIGTAIGAGVGALVGFVTTAVVASRQAADETRRLKDFSKTTMAVAATKTASKEYAAAFAAVSSSQKGSEEYKVAKAKMKQQEEELRKFNAKDDTKALLEEIKKNTGKTASGVEATAEATEKANQDRKGEFWKNVMDDLNKDVDDARGSGGRLIAVADVGK